MKGRQPPIAPGKIQHADAPMETEPHASRSRLELMLGLGVSAWVVILHLCNMTHAGPLWRDEVGTIEFASMKSWGEIWHNLQYDNFPLFFVALARVWTKVGLTTDFDYRVLGFCIGLATLAIIWISARAIGN